MENLKKQTGLTNGAASTGTGTLTVPIETGVDAAGFAISLTNYGAGGRAAIGTFSTIRLVADGESLWDIPGTAFDEINKGWGLPAHDGLTLFLPAVYLKQRDMTPALGTAIRVGEGGYKDLKLECEMVGATTPEFECRVWDVREANVEPPAGQPRRVRRLKKYEDEAKAGDFNGTTKLMYGKNRPKYQFWAGLHLLIASGAISEAYVQIGDARRYWTTLAVENALRVAGGLVAPGYFGLSLDFLKSGFPMGLDTAKYGDVNIDVQVKADASAKLTYFMDTFGSY